MQKVDFFSPAWVSETLSAPLLYIYDEGGENDIAHITDDAAWASNSAKISNSLKNTIWFLPVDHNLDIKKEKSSDLESTCDYLFTVNANEQIVFGEIKNRRKNWINEAIGQLSKTIEIFQFNHNLLNWSERKAYVSNYHKSKHRECTITREEEFGDKYDVRLLIQSDINL